MKNSIVAISLLGAVALHGNAQNNPSASELKVNWEVLENGVNNETNFKSRFVIYNLGKETLSNKNWNMYFNFARKVKKESITGNVDIVHQNGDFFKLSPLQNFNLKPQDSVVIDFISADWAINNSDAPAGLYYVQNNANSEELKPEIINNFVIRPFTNEKQYKRFEGDKAPLFTPELSYKQNEQVVYKAINPTKPPVIPTPVSYTAKGALTEIKSYMITADPVIINETKLLDTFLGRALKEGTNGTKTTNVVLKLANISYNGELLKNDKDAYKLEIGTDGVVITGTSAAGVFYGIQTLKSLFPAAAFASAQEKVLLPQVTIIDFPRYKFRGMMLDVSRNFHSKAEVLKFLDAMAFYKTNKFHFHLSDDEGWRLEIPTLPELTTVGAYRGHSNNPNNIVPSFGSGPENSNSYGSGYYSKADFIEILKYANERHIEVIPEIDVPGHSRAAIKAMDARYLRLMKEGKQVEAEKYLLRDLKDASEYMSVQLWKDNVVCICQESSFNFVQEVVDNVAGYYKEANAPFTTLHIGGDEVPHGVWEKSPVCNEFLKTNPSFKSIDEVPNYFLKRLSTILGKYNVKVAGWEEIALKKVKTEKESHHVPNLEFVNGNYQAYVWNNVWGWGAEDIGYQLANAGYNIILANATNLYFDLAYNKDPQEPGYYWAGFCDIRKPYQFIPEDLFKSAFEDRMGNKLNQAELFKGKTAIKDANKITGIQGQIWSENAKGQDVTEYLAWPRVLILAERAWASANITNAWKNIHEQDKRLQAIENEWIGFANAIGQVEYPRLAKLNGGYNYRIAMPGVHVKNNKVFINIETPGLTIRYTTDGSEPTVSSPEYKEAIVLSGNITVKTTAFDTNGRSGRTAVVNATFDPNYKAPVEKPVTPVKKKAPAKKKK